MSFPIVVGLIGAASFLIAYALLQMRVIHVDSHSYAWLNILGGATMIYSLSFNFNLSSFICQTSWLVIAIIGYINTLFRKRKRAATLASEVPASPP